MTYVTRLGRLAEIRSTSGDGLVKLLPLLLVP